MPETDDIRRKRLRFRSWRRGSRELDLVLGRFADKHMGSLTPQQLDRYEALIDQSDPDIYRWVNGSEQPSAIHDNDVLELIKNMKIKIE